MMGLSARDSSLRRRAQTNPPKGDREALHNEQLAGESLREIADTSVESGSDGIRRAEVVAL